jgi:hypothetical protein
MSTASSSPPFSAGGAFAAATPIALPALVLLAMVLVWALAPARVGAFLGWVLVAAAAAALVYSAIGGGDKALSASLAMMVAAGLGYALWRMYRAGGPLATFLGYLFGALAALALLAAIWINFQTVLAGMQTGSWGLLVRLVFALPCYLAWLAQYLAADARSTAPATLYLLAAEAALLAAFLLRGRIAAAIGGERARLARMVRGWETTNLLEGETEQQDQGGATAQGVFLHERRRLARRRPLPGVAAPDEKLAPGAPPAQLGRNLDFRLRFELHLHPVDLGNGAAPAAILRYAQGRDRESGGGGCPSVYFEGAGASAQQSVVNNLDGAPQLCVYLSNRGARPPLRVAVPLQRWVRLAFYYTSLGADVFVDDQMVHSERWTPDSLPRFAPDDEFVLGADDLPDGTALGSLRRLTVDTPLPITAGRPRRVV